MNTHHPPGLVAAEWEGRAAALAERLRRAGAPAGRPLAVAGAPAALICALRPAAAALAMPFFPLDPALPEAVIAGLIDRAGAWRIDPAEWEVVDLPRGEVPHSSLAPADIALLIATSGSSGGPRAVMLSAASLAAAARASAAVTPLGPGDRWLACLPLFHIGGFSILTRCAATGAEALIHEGFEAGRVQAALRDEAITHLSLVPSMLDRLVEFAAPPPALRHVLVGGAALSVALADRAAAAGWPIQPTYGLSETGAQFATLARLPRPWRRGEVGVPLPGGEARLAVDGRLMLRGPTLMAGYANPGLIPGDGLEDGWLVTGDLAEIGVDGALTILGRADDVIVSGGKKVLPAMVEGLLAACPGLDQAAVLGSPDPVWGQVVTVIYRGAPSPEDVLRWCREHVAGALRPRRALRIAAFPLLANGKPERAALARLVEGDQP